MKDLNVNQAEPHINSTIDIEEKKIKIERIKISLEVLKMVSFGIGAIIAFFYISRPESMSSKANVSYNWVLDALKFEKDPEQILALQLTKDRIKEIYGANDESLKLLTSYIDEYLDKASVVDSIYRVNRMMNTLINDQKRIISIYGKYPISPLDQQKIIYFQTLIDSTSLYIKNK
jgi:hypothetical protein